MKRKRPSIHVKPWTPFVQIAQPQSDYLPAGHEPEMTVTNSRYHVAMWRGDDPQLGEYVHLSIKDHDRSARHDWRDLQRIKNELVGPEYEAVEIYPAESRLVDTCNQYHLYVFATWKPAFGFASRLVADGKSAVMPNVAQRPFEQRPTDCLDGAAFDQVLRDTLQKNGEHE